MCWEVGMAFVQRHVRFHGEVRWKRLHEFNEFIVNGQDVVIMCRRRDLLEVVDYATHDTRKSMTECDKGHMRGDRQWLYFRELCH